MDKASLGIAVSDTEIVFYDFYNDKKISKNISKTSSSFLKKLEILLKSPDKKSLREELFNRKDLIEDFYQLYRLTREFLISKVKGISGEDEKRQFADNLLLTLLTLWFLQEREFFNKDKNYFIELFRTFKKEGKLFDSKKYFYEMMTELFDKISGHDTKPFFESKDFGRVVVLGPALFLSEQETKKAISLPDECFYREKFTSLLIDTKPSQVDKNVPIFNLFESRDWTEGNIDEYVLGAIYEKLIGIDEKKETGAHYTSEENTSHICKHAIEPYVLEEFNAKFQKTETNISLCIQNAKKKELEFLFTILKEIKICDPAVGSAHFLESAINVLVSLYEKIWRRMHSDAMKTGMQISTANEKGEIIQISLLDFSPLREADLEKFKLNLKFFIILSRNIYGVDINAGALKVARARFFLCLAKHFDLSDNRFVRFPNVHFNLRHGNSLLGYI